DPVPELRGGVRPVRPVDREVYVLVDEEAHPVLVDVVRVVPERVVERHRDVLHAYEPERDGDDDEDRAPQPVVLEQDHGERVDPEEEERPRHLQDREGVRGEDQDAEAVERLHEVPHEHEQVAVLVDGQPVPQVDRVLHDHDAEQVGERHGRPEVLVDVRPPAVGQLLGAVEVLRDLVRAPALAAGAPSAVPPSVVPEVLVLPVLPLDRAPEERVHGHPEEEYGPVANLLPPPGGRLGLLRHAEDRRVLGQLPARQVALGEVSAVPHEPVVRDLRPADDQERNEEAHEGVSRGAVEGQVGDVTDLEDVDE
ncbi:hypothetical protein THAOC_00036, partial [Thalassiosira oceanica]